MIKHIKKRKTYRITHQSFSRFLFVFMLVVYLISAVFIRTYNVHLSVTRQDIETHMAQLRLDNSVLATEIQNLSSKDRVMAIANENGLSVNQNNITLVNVGE